MVTNKSNHMRRRYAKRKRFFRRPKKTLRKSRRIRRTTRRRRLIPSGFPASSTVKLRFCQRFTINPSFNSFGTKVFSCNNLTDPDASAGGESVSMYATWMGIYNHYQVLHAKAKVCEDIQSSASPNQPVHFGLYLAADANEIGTTITAFDHLMEQPYRGSMKLAGFKDQATSPSSRSVRHSCNLRKFLGNTDASLRRGGFNTSPTEQAFFICWAINNDTSGNDPISLPYFIEIEYIVRFTEPRARATN